jgi:hypothetical protein
LNHFYVVELPCCGIGVGLHFFCKAPVGSGFFFTGLQFCLNAPMAVVVAVAVAVAVVAAVVVFYQ